MNNLPQLDTPNIRAYFDEERGISLISYKGLLDSTVTTQLYAWVRELLPLLSPDATRGVIFDFRQVTQFASGNISTARDQSKQINQNQDATNHPVALIVSTLYQEQMVKVTMKLSPREERKKIVHALDEALTYIQQWHLEHS
jgi:hypothetical protein